MSWKIDITIKNTSNKDTKIKISKGQVFENKKIGTGIQNVAAVKDYWIDIPANSRITSEIEVYCINQRLSPPKGKYNVTYFKINGSFQTQDELWDLMKPR